MTSKKPVAKIQQILIISIAVIIGAQIHFNLYDSDFKISIGILVFSVSLILLGQYPILPVTLLSAVGVLITRVSLYWMKSGVFHIVNFFPEMIFYLVYGILFYFYCKKKNYELHPASAVVLFFCDYFSNFIELFLRPEMNILTWNTQFSIFLVAVLRSLVVWCILFCLRYYKFSLLKREHSQRYQRLLLLISKLNDEVVLMQKNSKMIEETMNISYKLFQEMEQEQVNPALSKKALNVAKDVHEIKKEYALILRGISDALELNLNEEGMYLSDILQILKNSLTTALPAGKKLSIQIQIDENLYTEKHYFLMSVLRNLLNNAIEASEEPEIQISITQTSTEDSYLFLVEDNGPGIAPDDLDLIFQPGFSTKINYDTGEINRGLGLNLVQDLVEHQWNGTIVVDSHPGKTLFTITIPKLNWGGENE